MNGLLRVSEAQLFPQLAQSAPWVGRRPMDTPVPKRNWHPDKEIRMNFVNAANQDRKSGVA